MTTQTHFDPQALIDAATAARKNAYAPYSDYQVGAALLTTTDTIYTGCNVENAVYPLSICAERVAVFKAVSSGETDFAAIAVVTQNGGSPCGSCRQVLREFAKEMIVVIADTAGHFHKTTIGALLPESFSRADLDRASVNRTPTP